MLDSESRLREAIQKMLDVRSGNSQPPSGVKTNETKEDDLDMSGLTMEDEPNKIGSHQY
jgi:hypothetical protein